MDDSTETKAMVDNDKINGIRWVRYEMKFSSKFANLQAEGADRSRKSTPETLGSPQNHCMTLPDT